ncbi:MAG: hypothetical protein ABMB14_17775, partial [Myxococcota bacterium]
VRASGEEVASAPLSAASLAGGVVELPTSRPIRGDEPVVAEVRADGLVQLVGLRLVEPTNN